MILNHVKQPEPVTFIKYLPTSIAWKANGVSFIKFAVYSKSGTRWTKEDVFRKYLTVFILVSDLLEIDIRI